MASGVETFTRPDDIVDGFVAHFSDVFEKPVETLFIDQVFDSTFLKLVNITDEDVIKASKRLSNKYTAGPDGVPSFLVKDCIGVFAAPSAHIFNICAIEGYYPSMWKKSKITPIFKKGERTNIKNYRPIAMLSNFSKLFEVILHDSIFSSIAPYQT